MKKKLLFILLLIYILIPKVYAEDNTVFSVKNIQASPGQEITISINMRNNPSYQLLGLELPLDISQIEYQSCTVNGYSNAMMQQCDLNPYNQVIFYAFTMNTSEKKLFTETGDIVDIKLKVLEKAHSDIPLALRISSYGKNGQDLPFDTEVGYIKLVGNIKQKTINEQENISNEVKDKDVTWESTNNDVAQVDPNGNIKFNGSGNTTIQAKDKNGNVVFEKNYLVGENDSNNINWLFIVLGIALFIIIITVIIIIKKKGKRNETENIFIR